MVQSETDQNKAAKLRMIIVFSKNLMNQEDFKDMESIDETGCIGKSPHITRE